MRQANVYLNNTLAGRLRETDNGEYVYQYDEDFLADNTKGAISLTMPKRKEPYVSEYLFPFFSNMLSEGANKEIQCRTMKIDKDDYFGLLLATAYHDTIGAVTVRKI